MQSVESAAVCQVWAPEEPNKRGFLHSLAVPGWVGCHQIQMLWIAFCFEAVAVCASSCEGEDDAVAKLSSSVGVRWNFYAGEKRGDVVGSISLLATHPSYSIR